MNLPKKKARSAITPPVNIFTFVSSLTPVIWCMTLHALICLEGVCAPKGPPTPPTPPITVAGEVPTENWTPPSDPINGSECELILKSVSCFVWCFVWCFVCLFVCLILITKKQKNENQHQQFQFKF